MATKIINAMHHNAPLKITNSENHCGYQIGGKARRNAERLIRPKATAMAGPTLSGLAVWPRATRAIMPRVNTPTAPAVNAWVVDCGGIARKAAAASKQKPATIQP